ncbi:MAG TPA: lysophospholipid acyltransferase family protein [Propionibacteriaceae bacterium]|nr:lysophospholipid acyltransferase family protein [Propionibacteriaceae bacterium]
MIAGVSPDLPHTAHLPVSKELGLQLLKPVAAAIIRSYWQVRLHGEAHVPPTGPVILAANHIGLLDGPVLVALTPRLTFALIKHELFTGVLGRFLARVGQISLNRRAIDTAAITRAIQILRAGDVLVVFPEGSRTGGEVTYARGGAAYLAMVTGAPVVPVALLGTREVGHTRGRLPGRRRPIHVVYGEPIAVPRSDWPRRKAAVANWTEFLRSRLAAHVMAAQGLTGLPLPGPAMRKL